MVGAFSCYREITEEERVVFQRVKLPIGIQYIPLAVSEQIVAGRIYSFFCYSKGMYPDSVPYNAIVEIFLPLPGQGDPEMKDIQNHVTICKE